jgi:hypothetical protein
MRHSRSFHSGIAENTVNSRYNIDVVSTLVTALTLLLLPAFAMAESVGSVMSTDDVCAVRPEMCGGAPKKRRKRPRPAAIKADDFADFEDKKENRKPKKQDLGAANMEEFWERESKDEVLPLDIEIKRKPAAVKRAPPPPRPKRHKISFSSYMGDNHSHGAIGAYRPARQDAFESPTPHAIIINPGTGESVRENPPAAPPSEKAN